MADSKNLELDQIEMKLPSSPSTTDEDCEIHNNKSTTEPLLSSSSSSGTNENNKSSEMPLININSSEIAKTAIMDNNKKDSEDDPIDVKDSYNLVHITLLLHGIAILMAWNMFINATEYFTKYKLVFHTENGTIEDSEYKEYFLSQLGIASQLPNVLFNVLNVFFQFGGSSDYTFRILGAIIVELVFIILTVVLAILDTNQWIGTFFYLTMATVIVLNTVNGIYQNSIYGIASKLPMKYSNAVITGSNVCGTFTSVMNIITIWLSPNLRMAAIYYFTSAIVVLVVAFVTFILVRNTKYYLFYIVHNGTLNHSTIENGKMKNSSENSENKASSSPPYSYVFSYAWKQCLNVFLVFFVTLSTFPVIQSEIRPIDEQFFGSIRSTELYYVAVCCFLVFNACAMIGSIVPSFIIFPGPDRLWIPVVIRFLFIPFFMLCNYIPDRRTWPVLIQSDWSYLFGGILMALSSGYYSSLCMMYAPRSVPNPKYAGLAGMMAAASLILGIFSGLNFSYFLAWLIRP